MTVRRYCRAGHQWETVETADADSTVCPICGAADTSADTSVDAPADDESPESPTSSASFAIAVDELPPLPQSSSAVESTIRFSPSDTIARDVEGPTIPGYEMVRELGRGGMGVVYLANQASLNRLVAVKLVRAGLDADDLEVGRFRAEAEAMASLQHPNIVQVFEVGTCEGRPYFTQEYLGGGDLADKIQGTPWPPRQAATLVQTLAHAVHCAHDSGIVHRDLKPANVLFAGGVRARRRAAEDEGESTDETRPDPRSAKVTDFGIAKRLNARSDRTKTGMVVGTPSYMAPEQAAGMSKDVGPRADVYALGAILYELLTGRPPFQAPTAMETLQRVVHDDPIPPARLVPRTPRDLETICLKCLEKVPTRRYVTAAELAEDLRRWQAGEPILARPVTRWEKSRKWARRRPAAAALIAMSIGGVVLGTAFGWRYQRDLKQQRDEAQAARETSDRHFSKAIEAVDHMLARLGMDSSLASVPHLDTTRRQLLEDALGFYLEFLEDESEDPILRGKASEVAERTASILQMMGRYDEAESLYVKAIKWQEELAESHRDEPAYRFLLSQSHETLAELYHRMGRNEEARASFERALAYGNDLLEIDPDHPAYGFQVGKSLVGLGKLASDVHEREALLKKSIEVSESRVKSHPAEARLAYLLGDTRNTLGALYLEMGRADDALSIFEINTAFYQELIPTRVDSPLLQSQLAMSLANLGQAILATAEDIDGAVAVADLARAHERHQQALEIRQRLEADHPQILEYAIDVARSHLSLGRLDYHRGEQEGCRRSSTLAIDQYREILGRSSNMAARIRPRLYEAHFIRFMNANRAQQHDQALVDAEALIALDEESPLGPSGQLERLRAARILYLARLGRHREAFEVFAAVPESDRSLGDGIANYDLAFAWSLCGSLAEDDTSISPAEKEELVAKYAELSLQSLENAWRGGRLTTVEQQQDLASDPELEWLRDRSEFWAFVERIARESPAP